MFENQCFIKYLLKNKLTYNAYIYVCVYVHVNSIQQYKFHEPSFYEL